MNPLVEIIIYVVVISFLSPFVAYAMSKSKKFYTRLESGDIEFIMRGDTLHKIINDTPGKEIVGGLKEKSFFNKILGLYWVGIPPFGSIHKFKIKKRKGNPDAKDPKDWITKEEVEEVSSLRFTFTRPIVLLSVELGDRTPVDLLVVTKFEVSDPYIPVFNLKGNFFDNAESLVRAGTSDILKTLDLNNFIKAEKGEEKGILVTLKEPNGSFNDILKRQVGLVLVGISIPQYDPSDKEIRTAMNSQVIAQEQGKATIITANVNAERIRIESEADAKRIETLGKAQGKKILEIVQNLSGSSTDKNIVVSSAASILKAEQIAQSKVTTWVESGNTQTVIPVGGQKNGNS